MFLLLGSALFIVATDDPEWCDAHLKNSNFQMVFLYDYYNRIGAENREQTVRESD